MYFKQFGCTIERDLIGLLEIGLAGKSGQHCKNANAV